MSVEEGMELNSYLENINHEDDHDTEVFLECIVKGLDVLAFASSSLHDDDDDDTTTHSSLTTKEDESCIFFQVDGGDDDVKDLNNFTKEKNEDVETRDNEKDASFQSSATASSYAYQEALLNSSLLSCYWSSATCAAVSLVAVNPPVIATSLGNKESLSLTTTTTSSAPFPMAWNVYQTVKKAWEWGKAQPLGGAICLTEGIFHEITQRLLGIDNVETQVVGPVLHAMDTTLTPCYTAVAHALAARTTTEATTSEEPGENISQRTTPSTKIINCDSKIVSVAHRQISFSDGFPEEFEDDDDDDNWIPLLLPAPQNIPSAFTIAKRSLERTIMSDISN